MMALFVMGMSSQPDIDTLLLHFDSVTFGNEFTKERFPRVRKWKNSIRIGVQSDAPEFLDADIRQHVGELKHLTGHPVDLVYSEPMRKAGMVPKGFDTREVNVIVFFIPREKIHASVMKYFNNDSNEVDRMIASSTCFAKFFKKQDEIRAAVVVIPSHLSREEVRACVVEELTQVMGLPNDSERVTQSVFNDKSRFNELTRYDRAMVHVLYDDRMRLGMPRDEALVLARTLLKKELEF
ncbi:MAG: DUF2927 domain-containing protein [Magnetococcales bacterium]|nr:DUF2927 domain-containing protein [Magnetococcales bacterium]